MTDIVFLLNGEARRASATPATRTLLDWLRETRHLTGTKEGCNEGDCGACTVMITDQDGSRAMNACVLLMPQLHGKSLRTIEGLDEGGAHPVQTAMVAHHGSQCGFCTPGIVMSLATAQVNGQRDFDAALAGNLCRCTGYAPIIRAAQAAQDAPQPGWLERDRAALAALQIEAAPWRPTDLDAFADWYAANPAATLIGGATDQGLLVTKRLMDLPQPVFLGGLTALRSIDDTPEGLRIGAGVTIAQLAQTVAARYPSFAAMLARFGSVQVRNAGTLGGNIANGSPIGDSPPPLIALGARLHLRKGAARREIALEDFFIAYGKQDRAPGEFVEAVTIPHQPDDLRVYKISKRFDQDIAALSGAFNVTVEAERISGARIAFGGMAATPKRANHVEKALLGQPWSAATISKAMAEFANDFEPLSDMRASATYRLEVAQNLLRRYFLERAGTAVNVLEVTP